MRSFLSGVPFVLISLLAANDGGGSGGGEKPAEKPPGDAAPAKPEERSAGKPPGDAAPVNPEEKPAAETAAATIAKPSIFARAKAFLQPRMESVETSAALTALRAALAEAFHFDAVQTAALEKGDLSPVTSAIETYETFANRMFSMLGKTLKLSDAQLAAMDETALAAAVDKIAGVKAIDLAASQGAPAVPSKPGDGASVSDEIAQVREQAASETNPTKRAELHARANRMTDSRKNAANN